MSESKPTPQTVSTTCAVCNCVLWIETVDEHMAADHPEKLAESDKR